MVSVKLVRRLRMSGSSAQTKPVTNIRATTCTGRERSQEAQLRVMPVAACDAAGMLAVDDFCDLFGRAQLLSQHSIKKTTINIHTQRLANHLT